MDVLVHFLHRSERDMMLVGTSTPLSDSGKCELYMQRRTVDDDDRMLTSRVVVIVCNDEDAVMSALAEQMEHLLESGWHQHDWDPSPVSVPAPDKDPLAALDDALRLFAAAVDVDED